MARIGPIGSKILRKGKDRMSDGWVKTDRGWIKRYGPPPTPVARGSFPCPRIASDTMDLTEHVDGKFYDSKSKFRAVTKAHVCVEVGNDPARLRRPSREVLNQMARPARHAAIKKAMDKAGL